MLWMDIAGLALTSEDREILKHPAISGIILFTRNYESVSQLRALTNEIHTIAPRCIIVADQEGGRVQRFQKEFTTLPSMQYWGARFLESPEHAITDFKKIIQVMIQELKHAGVDMSLAPVLDIDYGHNTVIGERSFGNDIACITHLASIMIDCFHAHNMPVTGKHFPGHGFVSTDSHHALPIDSRSFEIIYESDMQPFIALHNKLDYLMPAHVVFESVDPKPVGFSRYWLKTVLRDRIHYLGKILSDDLSMQATVAYGSYSDRAAMALKAGCDILLICNARSGVIEVLDSNVINASTS